MVTFIAEGPVTVYRHESDRPTDTGAGAMKETSRKQYLETQEEVEIIMPDGHVNLDAYAPETFGTGVSEVVGVSAMVPDGWDEAEAEESDWTAKLYGTPDEWIRAAVTWMAEQGTGTVVDSLERFQGWEETPDRSIQNAIDGVLNNGRVRVESAYEGRKKSVPEWLTDDLIN